MSNPQPMVLNREQMLHLLSMGIPEPSPNPGLAPVLFPASISLQSCPATEGHDDEEVRPHAHGSIVLFPEDTSDQPYLVIAVDMYLDTEEVIVNKDVSIEQTIPFITGTVEQIATMRNDNTEEYHGGMYL